MPNQRRHANVVPLVQISIFIVIGLIVCGGGLFYVSLKNQLHAGADEIVRLEKELGELNLHLEHTRSEISRLTAHGEIRRRYEADKNKLGKLIEIPNDRIVWVDRPLPVVRDADELQPAAQVSR